MTSLRNKASQKPERTLIRCVAVLRCRPARATRGSGFSSEEQRDHIGSSIKRLNEGAHTDTDERELVAVIDFSGYPANEVGLCPEYRDLLHGITSGWIEEVWVMDITRLGRDELDVLTIIKLAEAMGVRIVTMP